MSREWVEEAVRLTREGYSRSKVAAKLNKSVSAVCGAVWRYENAPPIQDHGSWDERLFEPWAERKARKAREKETKA